MRVQVTPSIRFITNAGEPAVSRPRAWIGTMFGCSRAPASLASRTSAAAARGGAPGRTCLTTTSRSSERWRARRTTPMPPSPRVAPRTRSSRSASSPRGSRGKTSASVSAIERPSDRLRAPGSSPVGASSSSKVCSCINQPSGAVVSGLTAEERGVGPREAAGRRGPGRRPGRALRVGEHQTLSPSSKPRDGRGSPSRAHPGHGVQVADRHRSPDRVRVP